MSLRNLQKGVRFGEWIADEIRKNRWKFRLANKSITLTGVAVTKDIQIPFFHTFQRIELTQDTAAGVANADSFDFIFEKKKNKDPDISESRATLINATGLLYSDYAVNYTKDNFEREPSEYTITLKGTNTNKIYPILYVDGEFTL